MSLLCSIRILFNQQLVNFYTGNKAMNNRQHLLLFTTKSTQKVGNIGKCYRRGSSCPCNFLAQSISGPARTIPSTGLIDCHNHSDPRIDRNRV